MSQPGAWDSWVSEESERIRGRGQWRTLRPLDGRGPDFTGPDGQTLVSFASNDYLGLASHPSVVAACAEAARCGGAGTGSSRLIVGDRGLHHRLEEALADWKGAEAALVYPTGYQANVGVLTTLGDDEGCRIVSDELNHASIIDGARLARAEVCVYRHGDVDEAGRLVRGFPGRVLVVSDSVFSMDGDVAPVGPLSRMCAEEGAWLVLDDAHSVFDLPALDPQATCLRVGTLSKTLGGQGGFVAGPARLMDLMVNRARSFIFTTGLTPPATAAALAALEVLRSSEGDALLGRLRRHVDVLAGNHPSPIVPLILGSEQAALAAAARLLEAGLLVPAIRPPTVPAGKSRLRISLSAVHRDEDVARLAAELDELAGHAVHAVHAVETRLGEGDVSN